MRFRVEAAVGNADGVYDAAYDFGASAGDEGGMAGTAREIGDELARFLAGLSPEDCRAMKYGTPHFYIQLVITPED